jgi:hypothetical protein
MAGIGDDVDVWFKHKDVLGKGFLAMLESIGMMTKDSLQDTKIALTLSCRFINDYMISLKMRPVN